MDSFIDPVTLTRSMSDIDNPMFNIAQSASQTNGQNVSFLHSSNPVFNQNDLDECTFAFPANQTIQTPAIEQSNDLLLTALDRDQSTMLLPILSRNNTEDFYANNGAISMLAPFRGMTGLSLTFDEFGQVQNSQTFNQSINQSNNQSGIQNVAQNGDLYDSPNNGSRQTSNQSTNSPINQQPINASINPSVISQPINGYLPMMMDPSVINQPINDYDHSRFAKRQRAEFDQPMNQSMNQSVPYFPDSAIAYTQHLNHSVTPMMQPVNPAMDPYMMQHRMNQPMNQQMMHPMHNMNQPINQQMNQPLGQPMNQPINQTISSPANQPINQVANQAAKKGKKSSPVSMTRTSSHHSSSPAGNPASWGRTHSNDSLDSDNQSVHPSNNRSLSPSDNDSSPSVINHSTGQSNKQTNKSTAKQKQLIDDALLNASSEQSKKIKHQMTDRQRRAKIKESMDQLKDLVFDPSVNQSLVPVSNQTNNGKQPVNQSKVDQATVVAESVDLIKRLYAKINELSISQTVNQSTNSLNDGVFKYGVNHTINSMNNQTMNQSLLCGLNGAGVAMMRMGMDGQVLEVNYVFEMVTGFSSGDVLGSRPCNAPLYCSLSCMPKAFLRYFNSQSSARSNNTVSSKAMSRMIDRSIKSVQIDNLDDSPIGQSISSAINRSINDTDSECSSDQSFNQSGQSSPSSDSEGKPTMNFPGEQGQSGTQSGTNPNGVTEFKPCTGFAGAPAQLFSDVTISALPIVPHSELQPFCPMKTAHDATLDQKFSESTAPKSNLSATRFGFLFDHLFNLPPNHVLKLLSRMATSYGDTLESIQTMSLVRDSQGEPESILCLSTPEARRLVKPAKFLAGGA